MRSGFVVWRMAVGMSVAALLWGGLARAEFANPHGIAVIIGNKDYQHTGNVVFAHNDAEAFRRYVVEMLGFDPDRVIVLRNAKKLDFEIMFGVRGKHDGTTLWSRLDLEGRSDVVVFYSGHGAPGMGDKRGYLVPVNAQPSRAELTGYPLDLLWENLGKLERARSVAVYVDACFSGESAVGTMFEGASAVRVDASLPDEGDRMTLLTAASGRQVAWWDHEAKQGLFTKHLLDGLYGKADTNKDGQVTAGEVRNHLGRSMSVAARNLHREDQTATLKGGEGMVLSAARFPKRSLRETRALSADLEQVRKEKEELEQERRQLALAVESKQAELERVRRERDAAERARLALEEYLRRLRAEQGEELDQVRRERDAVSRERRQLAQKVEEQEVELGRLQRKLEVLTSGHRPGETFRACQEEWCPWMVVVRAGEYMMGSSEGVAGEEPRHRVRIGEAFAVGKYEVTFGEWDACVADGGCEGYMPNDVGWGRGNRPVVNVSWEDAKSYVRWLSRETGKEYRLLSGGEWEYVARAGTETRYTWGDDVGDNRANCDDCGSRWDGEKTAPVGSFGANGYGLHDVHGNVREWVEDCWHEDYHGAPANGSAWVTGGDCSLRVLRGGSWYDLPWNLGSAFRGRGSTGNRYDDVGFRIARTLTP